MPESSPAPQDDGGDAVNLSFTTFFNVSFTMIFRGFLTGAFKKDEDIPENDVRRIHPRFQGNNFLANRAIARR